jgi:hypothetical protein
MPDHLDAIIAYLRSVNAISNEVAAPVYKVTCDAIPIPRRMRASARRCAPIPSGAAPISSPSAIAGAAWSAAADIVAYLRTIPR